MLQLLPLAAVLLTSSSCVIGMRCVNGTGPVVERDLDVERFTKVIVEGSLTVKITPGDAFHVKAEGQENLIELLDTRSQNGTWIVRTKECFSTNKPFVVHVVMPVLQQAEVNGSGDILGQGTFTGELIDVAVRGSGDVKLDLRMATVNAEVTGSGDVVVTGSTQALNARVVVSGDVAAKDLEARTARAEVTGSGDISVNATGELTAVVSGSGDIKYTGGASVNKEVIGSGDIEPLR